VELTEQQIQDAVSRTGEGGREELIDGGEPGLRLRLGQHEARWSVLASGADGRRIRIPIGQWPVIGLLAARDHARRLKRAMDRSAGEVEPELDLNRLLGLYDRRRLVQLRKGRVIRRALDALFADLLHREANAISRRDISAAVDAVADRAPIHANRMLAYAKAFFGWAVGRGYLESNPAASISKPTREVARERTPSLPELAEIWRAAAGLGYPFGPAIKLLILTAARRDEIGGMSIGGIRVAELDLAEDGGEGCWTLPAARSKNGHAIRTPLCASATNIFAKALMARTVDGPFVFTTTGVSAISGWSRAKSRIDEAISAARVEAGNAAPMEPWRLHDLRRSFATHACDLLEIDPAVADRCLNHVGASTTSTVSRIYARNEMYAQRREALSQWAELVIRPIEGLS
jgi:integrase